MEKALARCTCGHQPMKITRAGRVWYQCKVCGASGDKAPDATAAAREWNTAQEGKNR